MYYFNKPMIDTKAGAVVVPVNLDGVVRPGTFHWEVVQRLPEEYLEEYVKDCRGGVCSVGEPGLYIPDIGPWAGKPVFNLPSLRSDCSVVTVPSVMLAMHKIAQMLKTEGDLVTLAVGHMKPDELSWDTVEVLLQQFEREELVGSNVELWVYPPKDRVGESWMDTEGVVYV